MKRVNKLISVLCAASLLLALVVMPVNASEMPVNLFDESKWLRAFIPILIMLAFIFMQPNLSMVILLLSVSVVMFLCGGGSLKLFFSCLAAGVTTIVLALTTIIKPYQLQRLRIWRHPESDPQGAGSERYVGGRGLSERPHTRH